MKEAAAASEQIWFLSDLLKRRVVIPPDRILGRVLDLVADARYYTPPVTGLVVGTGRGQRGFLPWEAVEEIGERSFTAKAGTGTRLASLENRPGQMQLKDHLFDKQIVDTAGAKVVRVNDLLLKERGRTLILSKVDVGLRGLLRRVGLRPLTEAFLKWLLSYQLGDNLISWHLVQSVTTADILQLKLSQTRLARLHPADLADILEDLDGPERSRLLRALDVDMAADALEEIDPKVQVSLIRNMPEEMASDILEQMSPDEAADILQGLEQNQAQTILKDMDEEQAEHVRCLLDHDEETAGGLMTNDFLALPPQATNQEALDALREQSADLGVVYYVYVEDNDGHLLGVVSLRELLMAEPHESLGSLMVTRLVTADLDDEPEAVAELFVKYGLRAVPVLDPQGRVHGVVRFKALLEAVAPHLGR